MTITRKAPSTLRRTALAACLAVTAALPALADTTQLGGVQGVAAANNDFGASLRSAIVVPLQPLVPPVASPVPPRGELRLWMDDHPDRRLPIGAYGRLNVTSSIPGYLMLWTMNARGRVVPIADGMTEGRGVVPVGPQPVRLPTSQRFEITICPPAGQAAWFAVHSDTPIPEAARQRLQHALSDARIDADEGAARFRAIVDATLVSFPDWSARSHTIFYDVVPGGTPHRGCQSTEAAGTPPSPKPAAPTPAPARPTPAFRELRASIVPIDIRLDRAAYRAQQAMRIDVRMPMPCPNLTVLALGAGGAVDVLFPNAHRGNGRPPAAGEVIPLPSPDSGIIFHVRTPPEPGTAERIVALCDPRSDQAMHEWRQEDGATTMLRPNDLRFGVLARAIDTARARGSLLVGEVTYTNLGP